MGKIQEKALADQEISENNDKICFNLLNLEKKAFESDFLKASENLTEKDFVEMLIGLIAEKSHFRDVLLEALKTLSNLVLNKEFFEKNLKHRLDKSFIDALFNANENYLDDLPVSSAINNLLCVICFACDELAKYIVEKGGLQNIIEEIRSLIKLNDAVSQSKKLFGLKFIESLVKDRENMQKFVQLKGADLVLNLMNSCIQIQDEQNRRKIDGLKNSEKSQIIKHNKFVVRNSVFPGKQDDSIPTTPNNTNITTNLDKAKSKDNNLLKNPNDENEITSGLEEDSEVKLNHNALGSEILEDMKNKNILNADSIGESYDYASAVNSYSSEINSKLDCLANYITETPLRIHESKKFSNSKSENYNKNNSRLNTENKAEVYDANSQRNSTLDNSNTESDASFPENDQENYHLNEDFFGFEETGINNENLENIGSTLNNAGSNPKTNNFIPYLVNCFKIIHLNLKFKMKDFVDPRLFRNVIQLLK